MHITKHAQNRMKRRGIDRDQVALVFDHGEWNACGDRLILGRREIAALLRKHRHQLASLEHATASFEAPNVAEGGSR